MSTSGRRAGRPTASTASARRGMRTSTRARSTRALPMAPSTSCTGSLGIARGRAWSTSTATARCLATKRTAAQRIACSMQFASTCREWALRPRPAVVVAVLLIMAGAPASDAQDTRGSAAAPTAPLFRSQTELVVLQAVVADSQHRYVADLNREDFAVYEEGARQTVALFASTEAPLD